MVRNIRLYLYKRHLNLNSKNHSQCRLETKESLVVYNLQLQCLRWESPYTVYDDASVVPVYATTPSSPLRWEPSVVYDASVVPVCATMVRMSSPVCIMMRPLRICRCRCVQCVVLLPLPLFDYQYTISHNSHIIDRCRYNNNVAASFQHMLSSLVNRVNHWQVFGAPSAIVFDGDCYSVAVVVLKWLHLPFQTAIAISHFYYPLHILTVTTTDDPSTNITLSYLFHSKETWYATYFEHWRDWENLW